MSPRSEKNFFELSDSDLSELLQHGTERAYKKGEEPLQ